MGALPRPDVAPGPHRELVDALHELHHRSGWPSLRRMASGLGVSHTTVSKAFSSPALPSWGTLELLVAGMGGDVQHFHELWLAASAPVEGTERPALGIAGRRKELATVRHHLQSGSGLLLVTGEAGIGKTVLIGAAAESVDTFVAVGRCLPLSKEVPLLPVIDALRVLLTVEDGQWMNAALADRPDYVRTSLGRLLPEVDEARLTSSTDDPWGVEKLFAAIASTLAALAATREFALLIEDCHWADRSTLDLLSHLASAPPPVPVVITWRSADPDVSSDHTEWLTRIRWTSGIAALNLEPLTLEETAEQLGLLWGAGPKVGADTVKRIHARSQGLPLYTTQISSATDHNDLPPQLADLLDRRIGDLDDPAWGVARVLGLAQRRVGPPLLRAASGLAADETVDGLRALARRGLLRNDASDHAELAHPLFVDAIQRRLLPGEGAQVHARLAEALSRESDIEPAEVADHWRAAGRLDLEISHRVAAARRAGARFAHREALDAWLRVLQLWDTGTTTAEVELWDAVGQALEAAVETGDIETGRDLASRAQSFDLPSMQRAVALTRVGVFLIDDGRADEGLSLLDEALELLEGLPPSPELDVLIGERINYFMMAGRLDDAEAEVNRALETFGPQPAPGRVRRGLIASIWLTGRSGDVDAALAIAREGLASAGSDPCAALAIAVNATGLMYLAGKPPAVVEAMAHDTLIQAEENNLKLSYAGVLLRVNVGAAYLHLGDLGAVHRLIDPVTSLPPDLNTADAHLMLGAVELREGRVQVALERCRAADAQVHNRNTNWAESVATHAEVELWAGEPKAAHDLLQEALDVVLPTQALYISAPLLCLHARILADRADSTDATPPERRLTIQHIHGLRTRAATDPFDPGPLHTATPAMSSLWTAELERIEGNATIETWTHAAAAFDRLKWPHDAAYCRWRAAQVAQRVGAGTLAARLLHRAATDARTHAPLALAIAATAHTT